MLGGCAKAVEVVPKVAEVLKVVEVVLKAIVPKVVEVVLKVAFDPQGSLGKTATHAENLTADRVSRPPHVGVNGG